MAGENRRRPWTISPGLSPAEARRRRAASGLTDQLLSSATNFLISLLAARSLAPSDLGLFSLLFGAYLLVLGSMRALAAEPLVLRYSAANDADTRRASGEAAGATVVVGLAGSVGCAVVALAFQREAAALLALALVLPGLVIQDLLRWAWFARGRPTAALLNDLLWVVGMLPGAVILLGHNHKSVASLILAWGLPGVIAGGVGLGYSRLWSGLGRWRSWLTVNRQMSSRLLSEFLSGSGLTLLSSYGVAGIAGAATLGQYRAGLVLFAPLNTLFIGVGMYGVPEGVRAQVSNPAVVWPACRRVALGLALSSLALGACVWVLPEAVGQILLGRNWTTARSLALPLAIAYASFGVATGAMIGLRARAAMHASLQARLRSGFLITAGTAGGAIGWGAMGAAAGSAAGSCAGALIWWRYFRADPDDNVVGHGTC